MKNLLLFLIIVTLPLLLGGCDKKESVTDTKPASEGVNWEELEDRGEYPDSLFYLKGSNTPYTGKSFTLYDNGQKEMALNYEEGKPDGPLTVWHENGKKMIKGNTNNGKANGLQIRWHENGQKQRQANYKDGEKISEKWWNSKGEPVDSYEESFK